MLLHKTAHMNHQNKTNGKWSTSHSTKFGLLKWILVAYKCLLLSNQMLCVSAHSPHSIHLCWSTWTEEVLPCVTCVGRCVMVTTFYILWNLLSKSVHFCKRLGWENKQRGMYVSRYSACEKMVADADGLEPVGRGGTGHWPWKPLWFGFTVILLWFTDE